MTEEDQRDTPPMGSTSTDETPEPKGRTSGRTPSDPALKKALKMRRATRLMVVQALYQVDKIGTRPHLVEEHFFEKPCATYFSEKGILGDRAYFQELVMGVTSHQETLDETISPFLAEGWRMDRLETILRAILRAGTYELAHHFDVPVPLLINEYVSLARDFFDGREPKFVNAVLDKVATHVRPIANESNPSSKSDFPA